MTARLSIAGSLDAHSVMEKLGRLRPVFHSEADSQHAFAQVVHDLDPTLQVRLEVRQEANEYLDLLCFASGGRTAIEFKYRSARWEGTDGITDERFRLRNQSAQDLARLGFITDIERLERFGDGRPDTNGIAILLTNDPSLWTQPRSSKPTRDADFRIHDGLTLSGSRLWAEGRYALNTRNLTGTYPLMWQPYSALDGRFGEFRWLAAQIEPTASDPRRTRFA